MTRKKLHQDLYVFMNGLSVGKLMRESGGNLAFSYDNAWLNLENSRPVSLSMPLSEMPYKGSIVENYFDL